MLVRFRCPSGHFLERAAHFVKCIFSLHYVYWYLCRFPFWFGLQDCVSDTPVPGHCLPVTLLPCMESYCTLGTPVCEFVMFHIHLLINKQTHMGFTEKT